ncbi:unnamed protein product [Echinostoma caproni]|uniref:C-type lectin domain-containing protein n=1 Tax=Echinostoma caproni TaxID=27848 RepID=A0A183AZM3_9TREM|nr:unnamed protein product [Echinostoma caproni]
MMILLTLIYLHVTEHGLCDASCPSQFEEIDGDLCFKWITKNTTYCEANEICLNESLKLGFRVFLVGYHAKVVPKHFSGKETVPTTITALLNRSKNLHDGWRVGDPGMADFVFDPMKNYLPWKPPEPNNYYQRIATFMNDMLYDNHQFFKNYSGALCELAQKPISEYPEKMRLNWPYPLTSLFLTETSNQGCFEQKDSPTLLHCAKL